MKLRRYWFRLLRWLGVGPLPQVDNTELNAVLRRAIVAAQAMGQTLYVLRVVSHQKFFSHIGHEGLYQHVSRLEHAAILTKTQALGFMSRNYSAVTYECVDFETAKAQYANYARLHK